MSDEETTLVAIGEYVARGIKGSEQYAPADNGEPQIAVDMQIEGGDFEGASMTVVFSFSGKAPEYSIKKLRMMGWQGDNLEDLSGIDANAIPVRVFDHTHNGKTYRKMEVVYGGEGKFKFQKQMDARQKRGFAQAFMGLAKTIPGKRSADDFPGSYGGQAAGGTGAPPKY
jgi:hypothetical protein